MNLVNMDRLAWRSINEEANSTGPAVYQIQLINKQGNTIHIDRFLDTDKEGILSIGMTTNMEKRRKQFIVGVERCGRHSEANLLFLLKQYSRFLKIHREPNFQYRFKELTAKEDPKEQEKRLIKKYVKKFGEVPPLNSNIPDRYDLESWDC